MAQTQISPFAHILIEHLAPSPTNPRKTFAQSDLAELADSIRQQGVLQPLLVRLWPDAYPTPEGRENRPLYEIIAGERRYRASVLANLAEIPALVRQLTTRQVLEAQLVENLQRRDVSELEEAEGYQLMMRDHGYTADELADKVGKSRAYIYARLKLTALCADVRPLYHEGKLDASRALLLARIPVPALQIKAAVDILRLGNDFQGPMSAREAAVWIQNHYTLDLTKAPFPLDAHLGAGESLHELPPCTECPHRTGNSPEVYPGIHPDVCTDPTCYAHKREAQVAKQADAEKAAGRKVITGEAAKKIAPHGIYMHEHGNYVALDEKYHYGDKRQTARQAIGAQTVPIVMIEDHQKGTLVPMVDKRELVAALEATGIKVSKSKRDPRDLAREKARKSELQYRRELFDQHHAAAQAAISAASKPSLAHDDLALIARQFWASRGSDACKRLARMYVPELPERGPHESAWQDEDYRRTRCVDAMIDEFDKAQLILFLLDISLVGTLDVPTYLEDITTPIPLLAAVQRCGLSPDAIRARLDGLPLVKTAPPPPKAAPAQEVTAKKPGKTKPPSRATKAARARGGKAAKPNGQAADAAKKTQGKGKDSGRASAAGGKDKGDPAPYRCPNTPDMLEGVSA